MKRRSSVPSPTKIFVNEVLDPRAFVAHHGNKRNSGRAELFDELLQLPCCVMRAIENDFSGVAHFRAVDSKDRGQVAEWARGSVCYRGSVGFVRNLQTSPDRGVSLQSDRLWAR